jgi:hypothetical protein
MLRIGRHLGSGRTSSLPIRIPLGLVALAMLVSASTAHGAVIVRPSSDVKNEWTALGASSASQALDDPVSAKGSVPKGDYIAAGASGDVADVRLTPQALAKNQRVKRARLWYAAKTARQGRLSIEITVGGKRLGSRTIGGGQGAKWRSISFKVPGTAALSKLRARFTSDSGKGSQVREALAVAGRGLRLLAGDRQA